jgi:hypothetical protein
MDCKCLEGYASETDVTVEDEVTKAVNTASNILYSKTIFSGVKKLFIYTHS